MNAGDQEPLVPPLLARQVPELGQVAHLLTCHICYEPAHLPAISPCHHLFCSLCIRKFLQYKQVCPSCHAELHEFSLRQDKTAERILELVRPLARGIIDEFIKITYVTYCRKEETADNEEEDSSEEESEEEEEVPGMSMKPAAVEKVIIGSKEKKAINKAAGRELQKSKGFKTKERMRVKKQRNESKFKKRESEAYMLASDRVSTVSRNLSSLSDLDLDKHIGDMMGEAPEDQDTPENVSETQSSSGSKRLRRKISKEGKSKRRSTKL